jgi:hypothetical protein
MKSYKTPAACGAKVVRPTSDEEKLNADDQLKYRSGVGSLLYLLKHSRPDLSNSVRELSKVMDGANEAHMKGLLRVIKYVSDTQDYKLVLKPRVQDLKWELKGYSDSDFAGDADNRKSVSGFIIYLNGCPIAWRSKGQKSVTLSSTEAEYVALSEVTTEIVFIAGVLEFLNVEIQYPIEVFVDNLGAIYLSKNATSGGRTKHIDTRYHFVREFVEDGKVKVTFVRTHLNTADVMTKNVSSDLYKRHTGGMFVTSDGINRKGVGNSVFPSDKLGNDSG